MSPDMDNRDAGEEAGRDIYKDIAISAESGSAVSLGGDAVVGTLIKDVAGNVIIHQHVSDKDAARNQRIRQHLLEQLQATWISGVLENSIHEVARLELGLESVDEAVERPWVMSLERPNQPSQTLPPTSKILDTYRALGGAMLILGDPGSGKTITLLELARELRNVALADDQQPIPVVFNLASWAQERSSLLNWLASELFLIYGVGRKQASKWLKTMPYHLLLDGLDEVAAEHRNKCVKAVNEFREEYGPVNVVVCSRTADYKKLTKRLHLTGAAVIQKLSKKQIRAYLSAAGENLIKMVLDDKELRKMAQNPLTLNIIALAYQERLPDEIAAGTETEQRQHLFTAYVNRMFDRRGGAKKNDKRQSIGYLAWLAARMQENDQTVYYTDFWFLNYSWLGRLSNLHQLLATLFAGLIVFLLGGLFGGLIFGLIFGLNGGLIAGLFFAFTFGLGDKMIELLIGGRNESISTGLSVWGFGILIIAFIGGLLGGLIGGLQWIFLGGLIGCVIGVLVGIPVGGIFGGLSQWLRSESEDFIDSILFRFLFLLVRYNNLPFRLVPFLDKMVDHLLLRKVGGGYIFIHRMLLEYFADLEKGNHHS